jgi:hypothetical protein
MRFAATCQWRSRRVFIKVQCTGNFLQQFIKAKFAACPLKPVERRLHKLSVVDCHHSRPP